MQPIGWYAVVLVVAAGVTTALCGPARWLSLKAGYVALPDGERRVHTKATPYGGGAAMFLGFLVAMVVAAVIPAFRTVFAGSSEPLGVVLAGAAIFVVGMIDDAREMSAPAKVAGQVLAASILYFLGDTLWQFKVPFAGIVSLSPGVTVTPLIMALWVIALTNAVNLIDGLDGLAAGVVAIGSGALAVYGIELMRLGVLQADSEVGVLVAVITCGICLGFLPFNFHPAKMFMGDAGALFLGLLMSASTMVIGGRIPLSSPTTGTTYFFYAPLLIPFFILGVPLLDMTFAFVRRTAHGTGFHTPDKDHIHHRLLRLGHGHRRSVLILWAWTALLSAFILSPLFSHRLNAVIPFGVAALGIGLYTFFHPGLRRHVEEGPAAEAPTAGVSGAEANDTRPGAEPPSETNGRAEGAEPAYGLPSATDGPSPADGPARAGVLAGGASTGEPVTGTPTAELPAVASPPIDGGPTGVQAAGDQAAGDRSAADPADKGPSADAGPSGFAVGRGRMR
jgi:UDP-GlcNAc:undecaprenyl-phosphate/decaprenyl-phosphate GlcNAc-1-phosphate transferase